MVPTVREEGPYRFRFYSGDRPERPHVHVVRDGLQAKFWLDPVETAYSKLRDVDTAAALRIVIEHEVEFLEAWHAHFNDDA